MLNLQLHCSRLHQITKSLVSLKRLLTPRSFTQLRIKYDKQPSIETPCTLVLDYGPVISTRETFIMEAFYL